MQGLNLDIEIEIKEKITANIFSINSGILHLTKTIFFNTHLLSLLCKHLGSPLEKEGQGVLQHLHGQDDDDHDHDDDDYDDDDDHDDVLQHLHGLLPELDHPDHRVGGLHPLPRPHQGLPGGGERVSGCPQATATYFPSITLQQ